MSALQPSSRDPSPKPRKIVERIRKTAELKLLKPSYTKRQTNAGQYEHEFLPNPVGEQTGGQGCGHETKIQPKQNRSAERITETQVLKKRGQGGTFQIVCEANTKKAKNAPAVQQPDGIVNPG